MCHSKYKYVKSFLTKREAQKVASKFSGAQIALIGNSYWALYLPKFKQGVVY